MLRILFFILFVLPLIFQIIFGIRAIKGYTKLKIWQIGVISLIGQLLITVVNSGLMAFFLKQSKSHDGLPMIGVLAINIFIGGIILLVFFTQTIVHFQLRKKR